MNDKINAAEHDYSIVRVEYAIAGVLAYVLLSPVQFNCNI